MTSAEEKYPTDYAPHIHRAEVLAVTRVGTAMVRVTLGGADMVDYPTTGVGDEWIRVFFPDAPTEPVRLPELEGRGWTYADGVEASAMRAYTVRAWRPGEIDVDFVVHGNGVATTWATTVEPGGEVGLTPPVDVYDRPHGATRQVLFCDEPGLPAALRIAETAPAGMASTLVCEVRAEGYEISPTRDDVECIWLPGSGNGVAESRLPEVLTGMEITDEDAVWAATETRTSRSIRKILRQDKGLARGAATTMGYWVHDSEEWRAAYDALGPDFADKVRAVFDSGRDKDEMIAVVDELYESNGL
ncbi:siderophore-interacting protein [Corynebacterium variabile]|uniref:Sideophore-iron utilization protein n=1 Tax=Corynebacterium variabile (strain DSM 44702 / CIP 107183 / JCM 12073 / NCIMB 30131) TaxID=858619 RepID=G0HBW4_CORVD|nr:siderophore-interacting protein [Corynebacterium variabile]AEK35579.1 sideophore-iron utilization protein [Corynebacterium variabile DSM 44702]MDN6242280.1 siderophore-interacting protein [Corynebacterium variabile]MDN6659236.1 siderophore-interacting protein [Acidipropionibacterium jensenii]